MLGLPCLAGTGAGRISTGDKLCVYFNWNELKENEMCSDGTEAERSDSHKWNGYEQFEYYYHFIDYRRHKRYNLFGLSVTSSQFPNIKVGSTIRFLRVFFLHAACDHHFYLSKQIYGIFAGYTQPFVDGLHLKFRICKHVIE